MKLPPSCVQYFQAKKANFDASHELEELLLEDNPLKARARKANQDHLSSEMRQMEEQYEYSLFCPFRIRDQRLEGLLLMISKRCNGGLITHIINTLSPLQRAPRQGWRLRDLELRLMICEWTME